MLALREFAIIGRDANGWRVACLVACLLNCGCSSLALQRHTLNQSMSLSTTRYQLVLDSLAVVANNRGAIPSYAVTGSGTANVTNTVSADPTTLIDNTLPGFSKLVLNIAGAHNPDLQWTVLPVVAEPNLEALRYACLWAIEGRPAEGSEAMELLRAPTPQDVVGCSQQDRKAGFHFNVASQLEELENLPCWLHLGRRRDVPRNACYRSCCGATHVWVESDGMEGLSAFTLIALDIATTDPKSLPLPRPLVSVQKTQSNRPPSRIERPTGKVSPIPGESAEDPTIVPVSAAEEASELDRGPTPPVPTSAAGFARASTAAVAGNSSNKDVELWDACQEIDETGKPQRIMISRPARISRAPVNIQQGSVMTKPSSPAPTVAPPF